MLGAILVHQGNRSNASRKVQREIVTRPLCDRQRFGGFAQGGRIGHQHPTRDRHNVLVEHHTGKHRCVHPAGDGDGLVVVISPAQNSSGPSGVAANGERQHQWGPQDQVAFAGIPVGEVNDALRQPENFGQLGGLQLGGERREGQSDRQVGIADRFE